MASTTTNVMANRPTPLKTEQFDMDSFFDFTQSTTASASTPRASNADWSDDRQLFNGPSHDYNLYKQQVGLPVGSMATLPTQMDRFDSNMSDMGFGWSSGLDIDADMQMDFNSPNSAMPAMFFPPATNTGSSDAFVDPNSIGGHEEPPSNVGRLWPGMHSQQAQQVAMQKAAQASAVQQRQMKLQAQHAQYRQPSTGHVASQHSNGHHKRPSHVSEPHVEESISRLLNQMRQNSTATDNGDDEDSPSNMLPHIARMKKDDEDMDEDERLLASEEGKKLSSKERRQLRNKVSARAFRSRRKEYIGQLEGEVAIKAQEAANLRTENAALMQENDRYRTLIETLLRHPAFTPFINDISKDPSLLPGPPSHSQQQQQAPPPTPSQQAPQQQQQSQQQQQQQAPPDSKPDFLNFDASQLQIPDQQQQPQNERVGLAMVPENDFSKININGFNSMHFNSYSVNAYPVFDLPDGPDPAGLLLDTASSSSSLATSDFDLNATLAKLDGAARKLRWAEAGGS